MTWADGVVLLVIVLSALFSMVRGFVREVLGIGAWAGAALAALLLYGPVEPLVAQLLPASAQGMAVYVAAAAVFIVTLIVLSIVSAIVGRMVQGSVLSGLDRSLGLVFGIARGAVIVCLAYILLSVGVPQDEWPPAVTNARFLGLTYDGASALARLIPPFYRPKVDQPGVAAPTADSLMQQPVAGSALKTE